MRDWKGERRTNATRQSTTDPDAGLMRKGNGQPAKLCYGAHALMDNRHGLRAEMTLTDATAAEHRPAQADRRDLRLAEGLWEAAQDTFRGQARVALHATLAAIAYNLPRMAKWAPPATPCSGPANVITTPQPQAPVHEVEIGIDNQQGHRQSTGVLHQAAGHAFLRLRCHPAHSSLSQKPTCDLRHHHPLATITGAPEPESRCGSRGPQRGTPRRLIALAPRQRCRMPAA